MREMSTKCSVYAIFLSTHRVGFEVEVAERHGTQCMLLGVQVAFTQETSTMVGIKYHGTYIFFCKVFPRSMMLEQSEHCSIDDGDADQIMGQVSVLT